MDGYTMTKAYGLHGKGKGDKLDSGGRFLGCEITYLPAFCPRRNIPLHGLRHAETRKELHGV